MQGCITKRTPPLSHTVVRYPKAKLYHSNPREHKLPGTTEGASPVVAVAENVVFLKGGGVGRSLTRLKTTSAVSTTACPQQLTLLT